jgi:hypothetical protein
MIINRIFCRRKQGLFLYYLWGGLFPVADFAK